MTEELYLRFAALLAAALLVPTLTFALFAVAHSHIKFWRYLSAGLFCIFIASAMSATRDALPVVLSLFASNVLVGLGYFLTVKSLRYAYSYHRWQLIDVTILVLYLGAVVVINSAYNSYEGRVTVVSSAIIIFSVLVSFVVYLADSVPSRVAAAMILAFSFFNSVFCAARLLAALPKTDAIFSLALWDPIFFIWSEIKKSQSMF